MATFMEQIHATPGAEESSISPSSKNSKDGSSTEESRTRPSLSGENVPDDAENRYFGRSENRHVRNLRALVFFIIFLVTLTVCLVIYFQIAEQQEEEFGSEFNEIVDKIKNSFEEVLEQKIAAIATIGIAVMESARDTKSTWPFVTLSHFQQRTASARALSGSSYCTLLPVVTDNRRADWEAYSTANKDWLTEAWEYQIEKGSGYIGEEWPILPPDEAFVPPVIFGFNEKGLNVVDPGPGPYYPVWQGSPILPPHLNRINYDMKMHTDYGSYVNISATGGRMAFGGLDTAPSGAIDDNNPSTSFFAHLLSVDAGKVVNYTGEPFSSVTIPVVDSFEDDRTTVAVILSVFRWGSYFEGATPPDHPALVVLSNTCQDSFTYELRGENVTFLGKGNLVSSSVRDLAITVHLDTSKVIIEPDSIALDFEPDLCMYTLRIYPTEDHCDDCSGTVSLAITMGAGFIITAAVFFVYDLMVERRQKVVLDTAQRSTAIVSSIFPKKVRDQLLQTAIQGNATKLRSIANANKSNQVGSTEASWNVEVGITASSRPIADLFPECTVMLADVEGFTAWSSVREPSQVFLLLETIFAAFDRVALRRGVFKVETVGDCYVAVSGLPEPRQDHAPTMARVALDCIAEHKIMVKKLEDMLGPETSDLTLRVGLNSGPITAGVLRGERNRFQLFGDTVNTASRLESSGEGNRIHVSGETARLIKEAGYEHWIQARVGAVVLKGKGSMHTFWVVPSKKGRPASERGEGHFPVQSEEKSVATLKRNQLVSWNTDILLRGIKQIVAQRVNDPSPSHAPTWIAKCQSPLDEVVEVIELPADNSIGIIHEFDSITIDKKICEQVHDYVFCVADLHRDNYFHNFEHASHVTMSVAKLLSRIVAPSDMNFADDAQARAQLHDHTYGITSDPLTQFACILSALIHDVDHPGVSNATLVVEEDKLVKHYGGKSVAEQNSVDQAWDLLMTDHFRPLVAVLCRNEAELLRLRQLVVNSIMATDIMDSDLKGLRNARWHKAFNDANNENQENSNEAINRKATIVIEHLIQASDVAHTMQHWNVYTKWNARLFKEMYKAYLDERGGAKDPSIFWAKGEIGFFDFYIIPLAKKLKECGVFGVSSDECLQYAISNRNEWEAKGEAIVKQLIREVQQGL